MHEHSLALDETQQDLHVSLWHDDRDTAARRAQLPRLDQPITEPETALQILGFHGSGSFGTLTSLGAA
jgi:hypothetical protein